jgi:hypothetical protein
MPSQSSLGLNLGQYQMPPTPYYRHGVTMCGVLNWREGFQVISRVPWEVETSFNEESSLQAASDTRLVIMRLDVT